MANPCIALEFGGTEISGSHSSASSATVQLGEGVIGELQISDCSSPLLPQEAKLHCSWSTAVAPLPTPPLPPGPYRTYKLLNSMMSATDRFWFLGRRLPHSSITSLCIRTCPGSRIIMPFNNQNVRKFYLKSKFKSRNIYFPS